MRHCCPETYYPCKHGCGDEPCILQLSATWAFDFAERHPVTPERALEVRRETLRCLIDVVGLTKEKAEQEVAGVVELAADLASHHNYTPEQATRAVMGIDGMPGSAQKAHGDLREAWRDFLLEVGKALRLDDLEELLGRLVRWYYRRRGRR